MKRLLLLVLLGLLSGCNSSVEEYIGGPVLVEPKEAIPETDFIESKVEKPDLIHEEAVVPADKEAEFFQVLYNFGYDGLIHEEIYEANTRIQLIFPEREDYNFIGWFQDEALTIRVSFLHNLTEDIEVYAKWEKIIKEPYEIVFDEIRSFFQFDFEIAHPIDFYVSPSSNQAKANIIYQAMYQAAGLLQPYLDGLDPISVIVLHPNDKTFYEDLYEPLELVYYDDPWFERTSEYGGAKVHDSKNGRPHMFFMITDSQILYDESIDLYVHETMHIFQLGNLKGKRDTNLGCMYSEGGATLLGNTLSFSNETSAFNNIVGIRFSRIQQIRKIYMNHADLNSALYDQIINGQNDRCNTNEPYFGYNLGAIVAEKMVLDFGIEAFMDMHYYFGEYRIDEVFEMNLDVNYFEWVKEEAVPYVIGLIT